MKLSVLGIVGVICLSLLLGACSEKPKTTDEKVDEFFDKQDKAFDKMLDEDKSTDEEKQ